MIGQPPKSPATWTWAYSTEMNRCPERHLNSYDAWQWLRKRVIHIECGSPVTRTIMSLFLQRDCTGGVSLNLADIRSSLYYYNLLTLSAQGPSLYVRI